MAQLSSARNPFLLMLNPEIVLAAVEKSERLRQLNRHLCRPLDRASPATTPAAGTPQADGSSAGAEDGAADD